MKKRTLLLSICFLSIVSCNKDKATINITDFSKSKTVELTPYNWKPYAMLNIRVKGYTNDTITINYNLYGDTGFHLSGEIDTTLVQTDYYGEGPVKLKFNPYKATEGELEIDFTL